MLNQKPIVFIICNVRSGSTLLSAILSKHPKVFAPPELNLWPFTDLQDAKLQFAHTSLYQGIEETLKLLFKSEKMAFNKLEEL